MEQTLIWGTTILFLLLPLSLVIILFIVFASVKRVDKKVDKQRNSPKRMQDQKKISFGTWILIIFGIWFLITLFSMSM